MLWGRRGGLPLQTLASRQMRPPKVCTCPTSFLQMCTHIPLCTFNLYRICLKSVAKRLKFLWGYLESSAVISRLWKVWNVNYLGWENISTCKSEGKDPTIWQINLHRKSTGTLIWFNNSWLKHERAKKVDQVCPFDLGAVSEDHIILKGQTPSQMFKNSWVLLGIIYGGKIVETAHSDLKMFQNCKISYIIFRPQNLARSKNAWF